MMRVWSVRSLASLMLAYAAAALVAPMLYALSQGVVSGLLLGKVPQKTIVERAHDFAPISPVRTPEAASKPIYLQTPRRLYNCPQQPRNVSVCSKPLWVAIWPQGLGKTTSSTDPAVAALYASMARDAWSMADSVKEFCSGVQGDKSKEACVHSKMIFEIENHNYAELNAFEDNLQIRNLYPSFSYINPNETLSTRSFGKLSAARNCGSGYKCDESKLLGKFD